MTPLEKTISASSLNINLECKDLSSKLLFSQEVLPDENFQDKLDRFLSAHSINNHLELGSFGEEQISIIDQEQAWDYVLSYTDALGFLTTIKEGTFLLIQIFDKQEALFKFIFELTKFVLKNGKKKPVAWV